MVAESANTKQKVKTGCHSGTKSCSKPKVSKRVKKERKLAAATIVLIIAAWFIGIYRESTDIEPFLRQAMPAAERIEKSANGNFAAYDADQLLGYITIGQGSGYGGPVQLAVAIDLKGNITGLAVVRHLETPSWFERVYNNGLISRLIGKKYNDAFDLDQDVDGVSGATYTSRGIANAALNGSRHLAKEELNFSVPPMAPVKLEFGLPEITLIFLFALGIIGRRKSFRHTNKLRWFSMLTGMVVLGFIYTNPLTISLINKMLLGYWPNWQTHLYWYLLLIGVVFSISAFEKNPYCDWFCPFGAAQECMGKVGGAKAHTIHRYEAHFKWLQRGLALIAVLVALLYRNPGISSYEIFGTLFDLEGNIPQFFLLGLVLLASLFIRRPWCKYLCPMRPVESLIKLLKKWMKDLWQSAHLAKKT